MMPLSAMASLAAARAYCTKRSVLRISGFSSTVSGSKPLTSAASLALYSAVSNRVTGPMPFFPASSPSQKAGTLLPTGVSAPIPVITTRLVSIAFVTYLYPSQWLRSVSLIMGQVLLNRFLCRFALSGLVEVCGGPPRAPLRRIMFALRGAAPGPARGDCVPNPP